MKKAFTPDDLNLLIICVTSAIHNIDDKLTMKDPCPVEADLLALGRMKRRLLEWKKAK